MLAKSAASCWQWSRARCVKSARRKGTWQRQGHGTSSAANAEERLPGPRGVLMGVLMGVLSMRPLAIPHQYSVLRHDPPELPPCKYDSVIPEMRTVSPMPARASTHFRRCVGALGAGWTSVSEPTSHDYSRGRCNGDGTPRACTPGVVCTRGFASRHVPLVLHHLHRRLLAVLELQPSEMYAK